MNPDFDSCRKEECPYGTTGECVYWDYEKPMPFPEQCESEELL